MTEDIDGTVWRFGNDIDTDAIIPGKYLRQSAEVWAQHAMEPIDPSFSEKADEGDVIVAERNFGIGSSREQAVIALKGVGIRAILADSFGRIFYRNAINQGLLAARADLEDLQSVEEGDQLRIDLETAVVYNLTQDVQFEFEELEEPIKSIYEAGGAKKYYSQSV